MAKTSVNKLIDKKDSTITKAESDLLDDFTGIEDAIYRAVNRKALQMNQSEGKILFDDENTAAVNEINEVVRKAIQGSAYPTKVADYLRNFETIKQFNVDIHQDVNDLDPDELDKLINPVQRGIVNQTLTNLTGAGINTNFSDPLREGIFKNIVAGTTISDLQTYLESYINTNPERMGQLKKYVSQVSRDALNQFDGQVNSRIAEEFGLNAFRYVGSIIEDSRPQCIRWVGKEVLLLDELSNEISWAYSNGTGMIPGTTKDNFAVYRGGYNCRHSAIPFKLTKSQKQDLIDDGVLPPDVDPIPTPQPKLTPVQKQEIKQIERFDTAEKIIQAVSKIETKPFNPKKSGNLLEEFELKQIENQFPSEFKKYGKELKKLIGLPASAETGYQTPFYNFVNEKKLYTTNVTTQGAISDAMGFRGKPILADKSEFEKILETDKFIEIRRGVQTVKRPMSGDLEAKKMIEDFKTGEMFNGRGIFGDGTYFDFGTISKNDPSTKFAASLSYAAGNPTNVFRAAISKDAKFLDWEDIKEVRNYYEDLRYHYHPKKYGVPDTLLKPNRSIMEKLKIPNEIIDRMDELAKENWVEYGEEGGMLTGFGFDGVMVKNKIDSEGNTLNYLNVFNRNKIIVEK